MSPFATFCALLGIFVLSEAGHTELRLCQEPDYRGDYVSFVTKQPNLTDWKFFTGKTKSFDTFPRRNHWFGYDDPNYEGSGIRQFLTNDNLTYFNVITSIRYVGAQDASVRAISFYRHTFYRSDEYYSENAAGTGIPFRPTSAAITGGATYTFFEGVDFSGEATCVSAADGVGLMGVIDYPVASFIRGCDNKAAKNYIELPSVHDPSQVVA